MKYIAVLLIILCLSCSSDDNTPAPTPNSAPQSIKIDAITFEGENVTIDWSDAQDADGDQIFYKLYINSVLIKESTESIATSILNYNSEYSGRIIGTDKKGGVVEIDFEISAPKSKILFYTDGFSSLIALDLYTLKPMWSAQTSSLESHTISDNLIYSGIEAINGIDILSGEIKWTSTPNTNSNNIQYRNIILDDTNVFAFGPNSTLYCVNKNSGGKLWERSFLNYYAQLAIDADKVFVSSRNNDHLYAINKLTGLTDWSFLITVNNSNPGASSQIKTNPLIVNDAIYFGDNHGNFYSLNKNTGLQNWIIHSNQFETYYPSPTQFKESVIVGTYNTLYAYNQNNGSTIWEYKPNNGTLETSPFIYNDKVYIGVSKNGSGELLCLNANDGSLIWRLDLENNTTSSPIVFENTVYIGDWNKNMYAVNAETGTLDWKIKTEEMIFRSPTIVVGASETVIYSSVSGLKN
ncbi:outer membrane protein assembly factor BamB family protein [Cellulophaga baltica]|uniref:Pyrrolo-quinoline quinone repeat domain-containing protein n=1 Tax=Cellulophaga baltica 18 TaxID=1348584 RepID=A0AAU8RI10_9FLAO|nr:PQQ-binding-like beta-propeller repeat protein [Cellulophaga baltica]AIZ42896.1 hypothetical protein M666_15765 [Cellulophaga baltica 18]